MKTLTPEQREQGFLELQSTNKDAHLLSFLAGIRHAEEVLGEEPKVPFVRLTDEELIKLGSEYVGPMSDGEIHLMVITQNALEEKNK